MKFHIFSEYKKVKNKRKSGIEPMRKQRYQKNIFAEQYYDFHDISNVVRTDSDSYFRTDQPQYAGMIITAVPLKVNSHKKTIKLLNE